MLRTSSGILIGALAALGTVQATNENNASELRELLSHIQIVEIDDGFGNPLKTIRFEGVNVQIVNGSGTTESANGLGNLLVGYSEAGKTANRTGSHNLVLGPGNDYESWGGVVSGSGNALRAPHSTALSSSSSTVEGPGGGHNVVLAGFFSKVAGGYNTISSTDSSEIGTAGFCTITGSWYSRIIESCMYSHIVGGQSNTIRRYSDESTIIGGEGHTVDSAGIATIVGGTSNTATSGATSGLLVGGRNNTVGGSGELLGPVIVGGEGNSIPRNDYGTIVGGQQNIVSGDYAVVGGGRRRSATGTHDWVAGALFQDN